jgi:signal transduction histidine kinase
MSVVTAVIYWALAICWAAIVIFYGRQYLRLKRIHPVLTTLLIVLFIDGTRTLIESVYFGLRFSAKAGLAPAALATILDQPYLVAIPKAINLVAALIIIVVIVRRWFYSLEREERQRQAADQFRSELISFASHELRAPLTSIRGYAHTLVREYGNLSEETRKEFLEGIASQSDRLSHLVSDLLDMSQIDEGRLRIELHAVTPQQLCEDAVRSAAHPDLNHVFRLDIAPGLPDVLADPSRIRQVLTNLISNAIKFSPEQSEIVVGARRTDHAVEFHVTDHGVGIPREEQGKLFSRFHRAANAHTPDTPGAGLGLYISRAIVESHGGAMHFHSELGSGSTFALTLPTLEGRKIADGAAAPAPRERVAAESAVAIPERRASPPSATPRA